MSNSFGHQEIAKYNLAEEHPKKSIVSEEPKQIYSTILDTKKHIKTITHNRYMAKLLVTPKQ